LYAWGIRNTWKFSFDGIGNLWAADVGQNTYEEINLISKGGNYGWNKFEADSEPSYGTNTELATIPDIKPVFYYDHSNGDVSITGGYVYDGPITNPLVANKYIFGDYVSGRVWALEYNPTTENALVQPLFRTDGQFVSSFGKDIEGNLYFTDYGFGAKIYQIVDLDDDGGSDDPIAEIFDGTWSELENGVEGTVETIATDSQGNYYIGGQFNSAGGTQANNLAKYTPGNGWDNLGGGTNGRVNTIAIDSNDNIYIGGNFTSTGGVASNYVALWKDGQWSNMLGGTNGEVLKINIDSNNEVYVGGTFISAGGVVVNNIARFNGNEWSSLTDVDTGIAGTNNEIRAITIDVGNGNLFVGGNFDSAGNKQAARIAQWNGERWSSLGVGTSGFVQAIEITPSYVYAGGNFSIAGNQEVNRIARWNKTIDQWEALGEGMGGNVNSIIAHSEGVFVGGSFLSASGYPVNNIAYWNPIGGWFALGSNSFNGVDNAVRTLLKKSDGTGLLVGGAFQNAADVGAKHLASFDFENVETTISCPENIVENTLTDGCNRIITLIEPTVFGVPPESVTILGIRNDGKELGEPYPLGQTLITWEVTVDGSPFEGCVQSIEVVDTVNPTANCKNLTVTLNETGIAEIVPFDLDNGSEDNCEISSYQIIPSRFTVDDVGINEVVFTVFDGAGNSSSCTALVTVSEPDVPLGCNFLVSPWEGRDIGDVAVSGTSCFDTGLNRFEVEASGADIWGTADEFHFVHQELSGDGEIIARVLSLDSTDPWAKAGVMMRNTEDPSSEFVLMSMSPNPSLAGIGYTFQDRPEFAARLTASENNLGPVVVGVYGYYMRLVRQGNTFSGYASDENGNWELLGSKVIEMNESILLGLAVTSHNDGILAAAVFDDVIISSDAVEDVQPPIIECPTTVSVSNDFGNCEALVVIEQPTAIDDVSLSEALVFEGYRSDGAELDSPFAVGETTITWIAIDEAGNVSLGCDQLIVVADDEPPIALCKDIIIEASDESIISLLPDDIDDGSTDNCGIANRTLSPNTFTIENLGDNLVNFSVEDINGNSQVCQAVVTLISPTIDNCEDFLSNEDINLPLPQGSGFMGVDEVYGTAEVTNNSNCAIAIENVDSDQPFANYRISIDLEANDIKAGDELFFSLDGNSEQGIARIEVLRDNTPNQASLFHTFTVGGWSTVSETILVPSGISSLDIWLYSNYLSNEPGRAFYDNLVVTKLTNTEVTCSDNLPNENESIPLLGQGGFQGLDSISGNSTITNGSECSLEITNGDGGQPFSNYRIPIVLSEHNIEAGDNLLISLDGNSSLGRARIEVNQDNRPNTSLANYTYEGEWSTFSETIIVPSGITSLNIWLYSNYLNFFEGGTAFYDNLVVRNLNAVEFPLLEANKNQSNNLKLFPNPSNGSVRLSFDKPTEVLEFQIFDLMGRLIRKFKIASTEGEYSLSLNDLPAGSYFIKTMDTNGQLYDQQMMIER
jgi:hypothetical protein